MDKIEELLTRGVANIIPNKEALEKLLRSGKKLNIYLGIDPTATQIHLGHAVALRKLQAFADLGHHVTFLIGDFTALIGDTSDKDSERPPLTKKQIEENLKTYKEQASKILDISKVKIRFNSEWLNKLNFADIIKLCQNFSVGDFLSRELIKKRLNEGKRVGLHEFLYPIAQGYDHYFLDTDLQIGATEQTFNMQAGRTLLKIIKGKESFILTLNILEGTDGRKMSKTWRNAIWLLDNPNDMFGKVMSIKDELIVPYFSLATNVSLDEIEKIKSKLKSGENPMEFKKKLAHQIVSELHNKKEGDEAREYFEKTVQKQEVPQDLPVYRYTGHKDTTIIDLLVDSKLAPSKSEARRLVEQGAVEIDGSEIRNPKSEIRIKDGMIIRAGKRKFVKVHTNVSE